MTSRTVPASRPEQRLASDALRFLRRFGLVAALWSFLLAVSVPPERSPVDHPTRLWVGIGVVVTWAVVSQHPAVRARTLIVGWLLVATFAELLGPLAGTNGWSVTGGAAMLVIAAAAVQGTRWQVALVVGVLSLAALSRGVLGTGWSLGWSLGTVLMFSFAGVAMWWLFRTVAEGVAERSRLASALAASERGRAVAAERSESAARLHDSVLQTLAEIGRRDDAAQMRELATQASAELRLHLRARTDRGTLWERLDASVTTVAAGRHVTVSTVGPDVPAPDDRHLLLVAAATEAVRNAVKHTGSPVRVLGEHGDDGVVLTIADRGGGFAPDAVPDDKLGVANSIVGRVERAGGTATVTSDEHGTEWILRLPATARETTDA
ncbi:MAG: hypothetical protein KY461_07495 [Actinobacteria bacterium]|nr:hypothetical protein [Actinomycetota bacterium]